MFAFVLTFVAVFQMGQAINGRCRALVLGGGSDRGAFQAGAISGLITYLPKGEATWDVVQGNGIGSLNALLVAQYGQGDEISANTTLNTFWSTFKRSMFYRSWFGGRLVGYYFRNGLYNSAAASKTINRIFTGAFNRNILLGVTDIQQSLYLLMNTSYIPNDVMLLGVEANLNSVGKFSLVDYQDSQYASGEIAVMVDVVAAIDFCRSLNYKDRFITIDIVLVNRAKLEAYDAKGKNTIQNFSRFKEIQNYHNVFERTDITKQDYPLVTYRTTIIMPDTIPNTSNYPFDYETTVNLKSMLAKGMAAAKAALGK